MRCKSHQDTRAERNEKREWIKSTFEMANVEEKKTYNKRTKDVCTHGCRWDSLLLWWWKITSRSKEGRRKKLRVERKTIIPFKNYNDIVHGGCCCWVSGGCVVSENGTRLCFFMVSKRLYRAYIRSFRCKKTKIYTYIRDKNIFLFPPVRAFTGKSFHIHQHNFTLSETCFSVSLFPYLLFFFLPPKTKMWWEKYFFSAAEFCDGKRFATFDVGWKYIFSHPFTLSLLLQIRDFPLNMFFASLNMYLWVFLDEDSSSSLSRLVEKILCFFFASLKLLFLFFFFPFLLVF